MMDLEKKFAALPGVFGTVVSWALHEANQVNWSQVSGFLTCVLVAYQLYKAWKNGKGS